MFVAMARIFYSLNQTIKELVKCTRALFVMH